MLYLRLCCCCGSFTVLHVRFAPFFSSLTICLNFNLFVDYNIAEFALALASSYLFSRIAFNLEITISNSSFLHVGLGLLQPGILKLASIIAKTTFVITCLLCTIANNWFFNSLVKA